MVGQVDMARRTLQTTVSHQRSRLWARTAIQGEELMVEQGVWWELQRVGDAVWRSLFLKDCILL